MFLELSVEMNAWLDAYANLAYATIADIIGMSFFSLAEATISLS